MKSTNKQLFPVLSRVLLPALLLVVSLSLLLTCSESRVDPNYEFPIPPKKNKEKPRYIWIDAAANFRDFANSRENIARDLALARMSVSPTS